MSPEEISSRRLSCARVLTLPSSSSTTCRLNAAENFLLSAMFRSLLLHRHSNLWRKTVQCQGVSPVLGALRLAEVVPYNTDGKRNRYRLKHPSEVRSVLSSLSRFVTAASAVRR